jgi:poly(3-hydroxybutyrate) depolymerase
MVRVRVGTFARLLATFLATLSMSCSAGRGLTGTGGLPNACGENFLDPNCRTINFGGVARAYLLHVPANFQSGSGALVIALHGSRGSGLRLSQTSGLNFESDQKGFAVAYPYALVSPGAGITEWNEFFNHSFGTNAPDDVGFIRTLIQSLRSELNPDPRRIFVTGLSNGGFMAHRVAVQLSDLVAAIGVVEGTLVSPGDPANVPPPGRADFRIDFTWRSGSDGPLLFVAARRVAGADVQLLDRSVSECLFHRRHLAANL